MVPAGSQARASWGSELEEARQRPVQGSESQLRGSREEQRARGERRELLAPRERPELRERPE